MSRAPIPLTVIGGYLGSGKTTLVNHLLHDARGVRLGVIVNDFGSIGIDVRLLAEASAPGADRIVSLPNGCVCCTIGSGLHDALAQLLAQDPPPDHIVVEVSGVADPAAAAAWATVDPFEPAGVIVLAAADSVRTTARDRYVGDEVVRQLIGADLIVVTKSDLCAGSEVAVVEEWLDGLTGGITRVRVVDGMAPSSVILGSGAAIASSRDVDADGEHGDRYWTWEWSDDGGVGRGAIDAFFGALPRGILRVKGWFTLDDDGSLLVVQRVGERLHLQPSADTTRQRGCALVAIGARGAVDPDALARLARTHLT